MKEDNFKNDDLFVLTNKSYIEKQELQTEEEQEKKDLNFLYQLTGQNLKLSNLKQDVGIFLELTDYIFNDIKAVSEAGKKIKNSQNNNNSKQKVNYESLYNNKVKCFNNNLALFNKKFSFIKEKNKNFKEVIDYLTKIKKFGFFLDEKFDIKVNDTILDLDKFVIHHKWVKNFEELINIKNKNFSLFYYGNGNYNLKSNFYEYYNNKYNLDFSFEIKINTIVYTMKFFISYDYFEEFIRDYYHLEVGENNMPLFKLELIQFYLKYLMYKFFKEEVNALRKLKKNESKETSFENNGLNFIVNKYPEKISMKCYYFDTIEIIFSISKYEKDNFIKPKNNKSYCCFDGHSKSGQEIFEISYKKTNNNIFVHNIMKFVDICLNNFLFNIKICTNINNFLAEVKKNNNLTLDNIIKNSIFIKNITTLGLILLKNQLKTTIKRFPDKKIISTPIINIHEETIGKYNLFWEFFEKGNRLYNSIDLIFDNNLNLTIEMKEPYRNLVYNLDQGRYIAVEKGRISFSYLFEILNSIVGNKQK